MKSFFAVKKAGYTADMGRPPRQEYKATIEATDDTKLYTQAALSDLALDLGLIHPEERRAAKAGFYRLISGVEPDAFLKIPGHGGRFPAWYGSTWKDLFD